MLLEDIFINLEMYGVLWLKMMNKYEEALNSIDKKTSGVNKYYPTPNCGFRYCGNEIDILRELVNKATPKKIKVITINGYD